MRIINKYICFATLFLILLIFPVSANDDNVYFEHIGSEEGLPQVSVNAIAQDEMGFLWIGTQGGLTRYNGREFYTFKNEVDNKDSLADNSVWAILFDDNGTMWIGTNGGLSKFDNISENFTNYRFNSEDDKTLSNDNVRCLFLDSNKTLWIGTRNGGLSSCDINDEELIFKRYEHDENDKNSISANYIQDLYEDEEGRLFIATKGGGLNILDLKNKEKGFSYFKADVDKAKSIISNNVMSIFKSKEKGLLLGTDKGLNRFNEKNNDFDNFNNKTGNKTVLFNKSVSCIEEDSQGNLWLGSNDSGLTIMNKNYEFKNFESKENSNNINGSDVRSLHLDKQGLLWVGTYDGGLSKMDYGNLGFSILKHNEESSTNISSDIVLSIIEDKDNTLWIGTWKGGVNRLKDKKDVDLKLKNDPDDNKTISGNTIWTMEEDDRGDIWIGAWKEGLSLITNEERMKDNPKIIRYSNDENNPDSLGNNSILSIFEDSRGILWIGTWGGGINRLDSEDIEAGNIKFKKYLNEAENDISLSDNYIKTIMEDKDGNIWIGTWGGGISMLSSDAILKGENEFTRYQSSWDNPNTLSHNDVTAIYQDEQGIFWICTYGGGLNRFNFKSSEFKYYTEKNGLSNSELYGILEDDEGFLWVSTNEGINKFDPKNEIFEQYDVKDGLQGNEFNQGAFLKGSSGELYFGGVEGLSIIQPDKVMENKFIPKVYFTELKVMDEIIKPLESEILKRPIYKTNEITLNYTDANFGFRFAALNYRQSSKNKYAYMLDGFDKSWIYTDYPLQSIKYTNINPGAYEFRVKAANDDGIWNEKASTIKITILPPWWQLWWVRAIAILFLIGILFSLYSIRIRLLRKRQAYLEKQVELRTEQINIQKTEISKKNEQLSDKNVLLEKQADELNELTSKLIDQNELLDAVAKASELAFLHAQIKPHFLYNTLNTIASYCDFDSIKARDLILSLSKHLRGTLNFDNLEDVVSLEKEIELVKAYVMIEQARFRGIKVNFEINADLNRQIPPIILQPLVENAIIHGIRKKDVKGEVNIKIIEIDNKVKVLISDNGVGMTKDKIDSLLGKPTKNGGVGLYNINQRLKKIYGQGLYIESELGKETTISFLV